MKKIRFSFSTVIVTPSLISVAIVLWLIFHVSNDTYEVPLSTVLFGALFILLVNSICGFLIAYLVGNWFIDFEQHIANILEKKSSRFTLRDYSKCWVLEIYSLARNIDEIERQLRSYHEAIQKSNRHLNVIQNAILESSFDAIILVNENGIVKLWNRAAEELFGYKHKYAVGKDVSTLIIPEDFVTAHRKMILGFFQQELNSTIKTHRVIIKPTMVLARHATKYAIPIELTVCRVSRNEIVAFLRDARETIAREELEQEYKERLERELNKKTYELKEANRKLNEAYEVLKKSNEIATNSIYIAALKKSHS